MEICNRAGGGGNPLTPRALAVIVLAATLAAQNPRPADETKPVGLTTMWSAQEATALTEARRLAVWQREFGKRSANLELRMLLRLPQRVPGYRLCAFAPRCTMTSAP